MPTVHVDSADTMNANSTEYNLMSWPSGLAVWDYYNASSASACMQR